MRMSAHLCVANSHNYHILIDLAISGAGLWPFMGHYY